LVLALARIGSCRPLRWTPATGDVSARYALPSALALLLLRAASLVTDRMQRLILLVLTWSLLPGTAFAHGDANDGAILGAPWTFDAWIVTPLAAAAVTYGAGLTRLAARGGGRRGQLRLRVLGYGAGWLGLAAALVSPLHWLGEHLFTAHMIEHEIVMAAAAPLLVLGRPIGVLLWSLPRRLRRRTGRILKRPLVLRGWRALSNGSTATLLHGVAIWGWHLPASFDAAVASETLHRLQHLSFLLTALLFWWAVLRPDRRAAGAWHLFVTMLHTSALGALIALAPRVLYAAQTAAAPGWGLTPLEDQQLAGIVMWIPAGTIYAGAALALIAALIRQSSQQTKVGDAAAL
jgi:cytochrome c oxidase assembly factor CtaG